MMTTLGIAEKSNKNNRSKPKTRYLLNAKLTDFGMCKHLTTEDKNSTYVSTSIYKPPELMMENEDYDLSFDIWSLGCMIFEIITGDDLFYGKTDLALLNNIFYKRGSISLEEFRRLAGEEPIISYREIKKRRKKKMITG